MSQDRQVTKSLLPSSIWIINLKTFKTKLSIVSFTRTSRSERQRSRPENLCLFRKTRSFPIFGSRLPSVTLGLPSSCTPRRSRRKGRVYGSNPKTTLLLLTFLELLLDTRSSQDSFLVPNLERTRLGTSVTLGTLLVLTQKWTIPHSRRRVLLQVELISLYFVMTKIQTQPLTFKYEKYYPRRISSRVTSRLAQY